MRYLKNISTGVILPCTDLLLQHGDNLVECDADGTPMSVTENVNAAQAATNGRIAGFVVNTATGVLLPYTELLAAQPGLIPVDSREEANALMARLNPSKEPVAQEEQGPALKTTVQTPAGLQVSGLPDGSPNIDAMDKKSLLNLAKTRYGESIDKNLDELIIREQIRVMLMQEEAA